MLSLFFLSFLKTQCVPRLGGAKLPAPLCQVRDRPPPWKPEAPGGRGRPVKGSSPAAPQRTTKGDRPTRPAPPRVRVPWPVSATMLTHAATLEGRARPRARPLLCTGSGAAGRRLHPPASALRRSSRPVSAAVPAGGSERRPRVRTRRPPPQFPVASARLGGTGWPAPHPLPQTPSAPRSRPWYYARAGATSVGTRLGRNLARMVWDFFFRPRPLGPPRATPAPAAGARCGDVTAWARASLLQVRRATGAGSAWGARQLAGGRRFTDGCRRGSAK